MTRLLIVAAAALGFVGCARTAPTPEERDRDEPAEESAASSSVKLDASVESGPSTASDVTELATETEPPISPFISHPQFNDCVHPGVVENCDGGWCRIPAGCYIYGSPEDEIGRARYDERQTRITLTRDFEIQQTEVTQGAWMETGWDLPEPNPGETLGHCEDAQCPVNWTSWYWGLRYANWLSEQRGLSPCFELTNCEGPSPQWEQSRDFACDVGLNAPSIYECEGYRLPTSAEWEYAARAGTNTPYYSGRMATDFPSIKDCNLDLTLARVAWFCANIPNAGTPQKMEQPVALLEPNGWGLYDSLGNVAEWVMDDYIGVPWVDPYVDPEPQPQTQTSEGTVRSCHFFSSATGCRVAMKLPVPRAERWGGFRLARTLGPGKIPTLENVPQADRTR